jgi:methylmalonyl-CoA/ethylmalonyl-CoA epimerase
MKFDHIGIFVKSLEIGQKHLTKIFKINNWSQIYYDPVQKVDVQFGYDISNICYELVAPNGENNPVDKVLKDGKNVLNHVAYKVNNINDEIVRLQNNRCLLISGPNPAIAFENKKIAFLYTPLKFIIELIEQ